MLEVALRTMEDVDVESELCGLAEILLIAVSPDDDIAVQTLSFSGESSS